MRTSKELQTGKAGEYIVCADLILKGFVAFPSEQGLPYDVLLDTGNKLLRVQVKTTLCPRIVPQRSSAECRAYIFNIKRMGSGGTKLHADTDLDLYALVCLDTRQVGYLRGHDMPTTINIRVDGLKGTHYDEKGILDYQSVLELSKSLTQTQISSSTGLHISTVNRMLQEGYKPHETKARYFSHFERKSEWFTSL